MPNDPSRTDAVARAANALTLAGAIPFVGLALLIPLGAPLARSLGNEPLALQIGWWAGVMVLLYASAILSFLGGIRFGAAVMGTPHAKRDLVVSVLPSLAAWVLSIIGALGAFSGFAVLTGGALALLAACFMAQWAWDRASVRGGALPAWFGPMRTRITTIVAPTLALAAVLVTL